MYIRRTQTCYFYLIRILKGRQGMKRKDTVFEEIISEVFFRHIFIDIEKLMYTKEKKQS